MGFERNYQIRIPGPPGPARGQRPRASKQINIDLTPFLQVEVRFFEQSSKVGLHINNT